MMSYAGLIVMVVGAILILVDQGQALWDARASVDSAKLSVVTAVADIKKTDEDLRGGLTSVFNRQMEIERKLAEAEAKVLAATTESNERIAAFTKEQRRLRNTIAPRQMNPKIRSVPPVKYDGSRMRNELKRLQRRFDVLAGKAVKRGRPVKGK